LLALALPACEVGKNHYDLPVLGAALYAAALWGHMRQRVSDGFAGRALTVALQAGYNRTLPSLAPTHLTNRVGGAVPASTRGPTNPDTITQIRDLHVSLRTTAGGLGAPQGVQ